MTRTPPSRPQRPTPPASPPPRQSDSGDLLPPKPYEMIPFPQTRPTLERPAGHDKYLSGRLHVLLFLILTVKTAVHASTGVVVMGSDIGNTRVPLIKTMVQGNDQTLSIQGSSLKGCIRSVHEAITNSTLGRVLKPTLAWR